MGGSTEGVGVDKRSPSRLDAGKGNTFDGAASITLPLLKRLAETAKELLTKRTHEIQTRN